MEPGFYSNITSTQYGRVFMDLTMVMGATGAVPSPLGNVSAGIKSVARTAAGSYTITLNEMPYGLLNFLQSVEQASYSASGACKVEIVGHTFAAAGSTILVKTVTAAGAAVDAAAGDIVRLTFVFQLAPN